MRKTKEQRKRRVYEVRVPILLDVIAREEFEFSVVELSMLLGVGVVDVSSYSKFLGGLNASGLASSLRRVQFAYDVLFWGCSGTSSGTFQYAVDYYYECIGDADYYWGDINV